MRAGFFLGLALLLVPVSAGSPALAQRAIGVMPLDRLLPEIRRTHPGQFFDADGPTPGADGSQHYHLKWMTPDGRIEWFDADARTGRVLRASPGRDSFDDDRAPPPPPDRGQEYRGQFRDDRGDNGRNDQNFRNEQNDRGERNYRDERDRYFPRGAMPGAIYGNRNNGARFDNRRGGDRDNRDNRGDSGRHENFRGRDR